MPVLFLVGSGVLGLLIGSFLNVVVWRVPRGDSLLPGSRCPGCDAAIRPWQNVPIVSWLILRGRCANCDGRISARYPLVELSTGVVFVLVACWWAFWGPMAAGAPWTPGTEGHMLGAAAWWLALAGYLWFAAAGIALTLIDLDHRRLPDTIVLPSTLVIVVLLSSAALLNGEWSRLVATLGGGAALFAFYFLIALVYPRGIGGGDVKLAPLIGAIAGFVGWAPLAVGAFAGFLLGAVVGLVLIAARRSSRRTGIPFGPFMLSGAWVGILWGQEVGRAYLGLFGFG